VPQAFLEPITFCRFERGDTFYDNPIVYALTWGEGKKHLGFSIQVKAPEKRPGQADQDESVFETNWTSPVVLEITNYKDGLVETVESTQGSLYTALRFADLSHLRRPPTEPPLRWKTLVSWLSEKQKSGTLTLHPLGQAVADLECPHAFVLAGDCGSPITQRKLTNIHQSLRGEAFDYRPVELTVADLNDPELHRFAPTTRLYLFGVKTSARGKLGDALKRVLYKPDSSGKTGADRFQLARHGVIIDERSPKDKEVVCRSFVHGTFYRLRYSPRRCQTVDARFSSFIESIFDNCPNDEFENPPRCSDLCRRFSLQGKVNFSHGAIGRSSGAVARKNARSKAFTSTCRCIS
jgi:hypothetical protein